MVVDAGVTETIIDAMSVRGTLAASPPVRTTVGADRTSRGAVSPRAIFRVRAARWKVTAASLDARIRHTDLTRLAVSVVQTVEAGTFSAHLAIAALGIAGTWR